MNIRLVVNEHIDNSYPWAYFDCSAARNPQICGAGGILFLTDGHFFTFSAGLGQGTNNYAELLALKLLILFVITTGGPLYADIWGFTVGDKLGFW